MAFKALEKQIRKKVSNYDKGCDTYGDCPICGQSYSFWLTNKFNYCHKCGQMLDWNLDRQIEY